MGVAKIRKVIIMGGVHGVGKSYLCSIIRIRRKISIYSASDLIRQYQKEKTDFNKRVPNINRNQNALITAIEENVPDDINMLLDGHFCLLNSNNEIQKIPRSTFEELNVVGIITIIDNVENILRHLKSRDNSSFDKKFINEFQNMEISYSEEVAKKLGVSYFIFKNNDHNVDNILDFMDKNFEKELVI